MVSPFALRHPPLSGNFPARNRIIAGLSRGCLVIQAAQKSGASITAKFALEQGKEVFVVPGPIDDMFNVGGHALLQQGAKLVTCAEDILSEFHETFPLRAQQMQSQSILQQSLLESRINQNIDPLVLLCKKSCSLEELASLSGLTLEDVQTKMFDLQLEGKVTQNFAGLWQACP